jgi:hypothetical protein
LLRPPTAKEGHRMKLHANAPLGPKGREVMVLLEVAELALSLSAGITVAT